MEGSHTKPHGESQSDATATPGVFSIGSVVNPPQDIDEYTRLSDPSLVIPFAPDHGNDDDDPDIEARITEGLERKRGTPWESHWMMP